MKRKDLVVGQKYVVYSANSWQADTRGASYFDDDSWYAPMVVEIVDTSEYRKNSSWWGDRAIEAKVAKAYKWKPSKVNADISDDGTPKSSYRNVLVKLVADDRNDEAGELMIVALNSIRFPMCVWKRRSMKKRESKRNEEREAELLKIQAESVRRRWVRGEGKIIKNKLRKAGRKANFNPDEVFEEELSRLSECPAYEDWGRDEPVVAIPYPVFLKLLELV